MNSCFTKTLSGRYEKANHERPLFHFLEFVALYNSFGDGWSEDNPNWTSQNQYLNIYLTKRDVAFFLKDECGLENFHGWQEFEQESQTKGEQPANDEDNEEDAEQADQPSANTPQQKRAENMQAHIIAALMANNQAKGQALLDMANRVRDGRLRASLQQWGHDLRYGTPEQQRRATEQLAEASATLGLGAAFGPKGGGSGAKAAAGQTATTIVRTAVSQTEAAAGVASRRAALGRAVVGEQKFVASNKAPKVRPPASPVGEKIIPVGESYIPSSPQAVKGTTVTLAQEQRLANGELIPKGSVVTWSDNAVKVVRPDGSKRVFNSRDWEQKALPKPSLSSLANLTSKEQKVIRYLARDNGKIIVNGEQIPVNRLPQDINVKPTPPSPLNGSGRTIGKSKSQNQIMQDDVAYLRSMGAEDIRINQQQVNNQMCRVGICRPDVQATLPNSNKRIYIEYDRTSSNRGAGHASRALSNDPDAIVILRTVD